MYNLHATLLVSQLKCSELNIILKREGGDHFSVLVTEFLFTVCSQKRQVARIFFEKERDEELKTQSRVGDHFNFFQFNVLKIMNN